MYKINIIKTDENISATCVVNGKVSIASVDNLQNGSWWISRVNVQGAPKGQGVGSKLLQTIIENVLISGPAEIIVAPGGYEGNTKQQFKFYKKNGFINADKKGLLKYNLEPNKKKEPKTEGVVIITNHAYDRAKERFSLSKKAVDRFAEKAFTKGLKQEDTNGQLKKYIHSLWLDCETANNIRIHGEVIFFFTDNKLVTLYQVPLEFRKILKHFR